MSSDDLLSRIRLIRSQSIGPVTCRQLLTRFGDPEAALCAIPDLAVRGRKRPPVLFSEEAARREMAAVEACGARYLVLGHGLCPRALAQLDDAPPLLIVKGDTRLLDRPLVALVGARNASAAACRFARGLAHDLAGEGVTVVSGLARGIDAAAHAGALDGGTIGVVAGGIDIFYPPENEALQRAMFDRALVVAEMPPGTEPRARHFPYRNRIIAGLSLGTVVIEAAPRSGSLITARLAAEMGRDVMAVPGSPLDPRAQGCNGLIRDGATLIQNAADVLEVVRPSAVGRVASPRTSYDPVSSEPGEDDRRRVEDLLGPSPVPVDELVRLSGLPSGALQLVLLELDLAGRIDRHAGGKVSLQPA
ncbi:MAG TPA: DNA-processing protein DprA [Sphingomicrobium sp.]|nr:DNA-processing protein DprA [Sphingomicrobium sp.]